MTGPLKFDAGTRTRILANMTVDFDPTGSTVELKVDGTWYPATWQGTAAQGQRLNERTRKMEACWTQTARTTGYFAGPEVTAPGAAVVLTQTPTKRHPTQTRITTGSDIIVADSDPIDIA